MRDGFATDFEKYLRGEPLSEELAKLRAGELVDGLTPGLIHAILGRQEPAAAWPADDEQRSLTRDERQALREGQQVGAVTTLMRLMRRSLRSKIRQATLDSENDPLARSQEIARSWAYIAVYRIMLTELESAIAGEIQELEKEERGQ